jgi:hypothetical protein
VTLSAVGPNQTRPPGQGLQDGLQHSPMHMPVPSANSPEGYTGQMPGHGSQYSHVNATGQESSNYLAGDNNGFAAGTAQNTNTMND